jgi:hypothetical protein
MKILIKIIVFFAFLLASIHVYASYFGTFEIIAEVISKDSQGYKLVRIAKRATGGHEIEAHKYSYYLFPTPIEQYVTLPEGTAIGDLVKLNCSIVSNPGFAGYPGHHSEEYTFSTMADQSLKDEISKALSGWQEGVKKDFYFKTSKPFVKKVVYTPMLDANGIHGDEGVFQFFIRLTDEIGNDYSEENIRKFFGDFHFNIFLHHGPVEIIRYFNFGKSLSGKPFKDGKTVDIGEPDETGFIFEIEKIEDGIMFGYMKGKIDKSSGLTYAPDDFEGIPYEIRFEIPME